MKQDMTWCLLWVAILDVNIHPMVVRGSSEGRVNRWGNLKVGSQSCIIQKTVSDGWSGLRRHEWGKFSKGCQVEIKLKCGKDGIWNGDATWNAYRIPVCCYCCCPTLEAWSQYLNKRERGKRMSSKRRGGSCDITLFGNESWWEGSRAAKYE